MFENLYLKANPDGEVFCEWNRSHPNDEWKIERTTKGYVSIKSCYNKYLCADEEFYVTADRECCGLWEQWAIVDEPHLLTTPVREVYIRSCRQQSFRYDDALPALSYSLDATNYGQAVDNEKWQLVCVDDNKVALCTDIDENGDASCHCRYDDGTIRIGDFFAFRNQLWTLENVEGFVSR